MYAHVCMYVYIHDAPSCVLMYVCKCMHVCRCVRPSVCTPLSLCDRVRLSPAATCDVGEFSRLNLTTQKAVRCDRSGMGVARCRFSPSRARPLLALLLFAPPLRTLSKKKGKRRSQRSGKGRLLRGFRRLFGLGLEMPA